MDPLLCHESLLPLKSTANDVLMFAEGLHLQNKVLSEGSSHLHTVLAQLNAKLNDTKTRLEGLLLLNDVLRQVSPHVFTENCQQWVQHLKKIALHDADLDLRCLSMEVLGEILSLAAEHPEQNRHMASTLVPQLIPPLLNLHEKYDRAVAHGLHSAMKFLPGSCRQHSVAIQKRLVEMLSLKNSELVEISSSCFAMLPSLSGGERGKTQAAAWSELYGKLLCSLHSELNVLYENLEVDQQTGHDSSDQILFPATLEHADPAAIFVDAYHRAISICVCLQEMLSVGSSTAITVPLSGTMGLVSRVLKVTGKAISSRSTGDAHMVLLFTYLPSLHKEALGILENLILTCRIHMLLHDQKILSLLYQTLQWTSAVQQSGWESRHALSPLRGVVYRVFNTWLNVTGERSDLEHVGDGIARHMLKDINHENALELPQLASLGLGKTSKKKGKKRKLEEPAMDAQASSKFLVDVKTCHMALKGLKCIVRNAAYDLKTGTLKALYLTVVTVLLRLRQGSSGFAAVPPYDDGCCRRSLYKLLLAIVDTQCEVSHELLCKGIYIFTHGQMDRNPKITDICCQGLTTCRMIIEPIRCGLPDGQPSRTRADASDDNRPESPMSEEDVEMTPGSEIPAFVHTEVLSPMKKVKPQDHELVANGDCKLQNGANSNTQELVENGSSKELPAVSSDVSDKKEEEEMDEEKEEEMDEEKEEEMDEEKEEEEEVVELPNIEQVAINSPGVVKVQSPIRLHESKLDAEDPNCSDSSVTEIEVEEVKDRNKDSTDASSVAESAVADAILRSFVDSYPDDCESDGH